MSAALRIALALVCCAAACRVDNPAWDGVQGSESGSGSAGDDGYPSAPRCMALDPPDGTIVDVDPSQADELDEIVAAAAPDTTIRLADGVYPRTDDTPITVAAPGVTLRSASGDADAVVIDGGYAVSDLVVVVADDVTLAELTLAHATARLMSIAPKDGIAPQRPRVHGVHFTDARAFAIDVQADPGITVFVDDGEVACSRFVTTDDRRAMPDSCDSMSALRGYGTAGWSVHDNVFDGYWCPATASFAVLHFGYGARDTVIERNLFRDSYRGPILGFERSDIAPARPPPDGSACPQGQHFGGSFRNNMLWVGSPGLAAATPAMDSMLAVWSACDVDVQHNTLVNLFDVLAGIEHRFTDTTGSIVDNLMTDQLWVRDPAAVVVAGNVAEAGLESFVDPALGDLHLVATSPAIDAGVLAGAPAVADDYDGDARDARPDVGADEWHP